MIRQNYCVLRKEFHVSKAKLDLYVIFMYGMGSLANFFFFLQNILFGRHLISLLQFSRAME